MNVQSTGDFDPARLARLDKHLARYVDDGRMVGWHLAITRHGEVQHDSTYGLRDREAGLPVESDTIWRIASMTKPIVSVAALTLWEEGVFELTDPISKWIPAFEDVRVYSKGSAAAMVTVPAIEPIRVWHLFTHTSGITAGWMHNSIVDEAYRNAGYEFGAPEHAKNIADVVEDWAKLPLLFQPGTAWGYGNSHEVLGRLIEIWSGQPLDEAVRSRVTEPLGMTDTVWWCDESRLPRLAALYMPDAAGQATRLNAWESDVPPSILIGGGGMLGTTADYIRFMQMMLNEGELDGVRILAPATIRMMTGNHLKGDLEQLSSGGFAETSLEGVGFGLGVAVLVDPLASHSVASKGEYYWGGIFGTAFWCDPVQDLSCVFMTQLMPASAYPVRTQLRQLVYSALIR
ncbi:MAG TPA: serine hydrolase domain-containing protein [Mycobacteriales bacterium]|nr:serine hydrolase domain-containing protein [Mycobacteriales bacterium]